jgi:hypothetical protein
VLGELLRGHDLPNPVVQLRARAGYDFLIVALVALVARLSHAWFVAQTPFFEGPIIDSETYRALASHIARTGDFGGAFYQPPLYPSFLGLLFSIGLSSAWQVAFVQSVFGSGTAVLLVAIGRRLAGDPRHSRAVGLLAGLAAALYGPLVLFDVEVLPPCCVNLLFAVSLLLALRTAKLGAADALLGLALGLGVVAWPLSAAFVPALLALRARALHGQRLAWLLIVMATASVPVLVTAQHNRSHGAPGVLVSHNFGINLWLGNNPAWRDTWRARPGASFEPELERPDREGVNAPAARSDYFVRLVVRDWLADPSAAVARTARKFYYVWAGHEIRRDQDIAYLREASPVLRALQWEAGLAFPFGLLAPIGLMALWRRREERQVRWLSLAVLSYALLLALFFVSARYRLPLVIVLLPFAAEQALHWSRLSRRASVLALALVLVLNLPSDFSKTFAASPAERGVLVARSWRNQGNWARASQQSSHLLLRFPDDADVRMLRAELLVAHGACSEAELHLKRTIDLAPRTVTPRLLLADCLAERGDLAGAQRALAGGLALHPYHPIGLKQGAALFLRQRRSAEARLLLERFVASGYRDPEVSAWLAALRRPLDS